MQFNKHIANAFLKAVKEIELPVSRILFSGKREAVAFDGLMVFATGGPQDIRCVDSLSLVPDASLPQASGNNYAKEGIPRPIYRGTAYP